MDFSGKRLIRFLAVVLLFASFGSYAQEPEEYNLSSPYQTVFTHLRNLQEETFHPEISAKVFNPADAEGERAQELAIKLKQIFDGKGIRIDMDLVPKNPEYRDSIQNNLQRYVPAEQFPEIYLQKTGSNWYYSSRTVSVIDEIHKDVYPYGTDKLLKLAPKIGHKRFLGLHLWQHIGILVLIFISFIVHRIFTIVIERIFTRLLVRLGHDRLAKRVILPIARPVSILIIFPILMLFVPILQLPVKLNYYILLVLRAGWPLFATIFFYRLVDIFALYLQKLAGKTESTLDDQLVPLIRKTLKAFVVISGFLFILNNLEFDITALIAGISIGGLAFALAAQDTIKNFFGSLMIFIDKPFQVGHWITYGNVDGTVEEVGFRSTRIRTFRNSLTYVPNAALADSTIDNHGLRVYRRFSTKIALTYDTPPDIIELFVEGLKRIVEEHPGTRKDYYEIHMNDMADSSLQVMFYIFFDVPSWHEELEARHGIILSIIRLAHELGVNFAFPTQTIHVENLPGQPSLSPKYDSREELRPVMEKFFDKNKKKNEDN